MDKANPGEISDDKFIDKLGIFTANKMDDIVKMSTINPMTRAILSNLRNRLVFRFPFVITIPSPKISKKGFL